MQAKKLAITTATIVAVIAVSIGTIFVINNYSEKQAVNTPTKTQSPSQTTKSPTPKTTTTTNSKIKGYTMSDVSQHKTKNDCWLIIDGEVYDVTEFISSHPGGDDILKGCGKDATRLFKGEDEHQQEALNTLPTYKIGILN